jgi:hypothetical protein
VPGKAEVGKAKSTCHVEIDSAHINGMVDRYKMQITDHLKTRQSNLPRGLTPFGMSVMRVK